MSRFQIFLIVLAIIIAFIVMVSFVFLSFRRTSLPEPSPSTPTQSTQRSIDLENVDSHPQSGGIYQTVSTEAAQLMNRDKIIGQFLKKLPYKTDVFSIVYDINTNSFIVELSPNRRGEANREFDQFLQENGIIERDWLYNLTLKSQTY